MSYISKQVEQRLNSLDELHVILSKLALSSKKSKIQLKEWSWVTQKIGLPVYGKLFFRDA